MENLCKNLVSKFVTYFTFQILTQKLPVKLMLKNFKNVYELAKINKIFFNPQYPSHYLVVFCIITRSISYYLVAPLLVPSSVLQYHSQQLVVTPGATRITSQYLVASGSTTLSTLQCFVVPRSTTPRPVSLQFYSRTKLFTKLFVFF